MTNIAVIYYSSTGNVHALAEAVADDRLRRRQLGDAAAGRRTCTAAAACSWPR
jgi:hypothetical protein